MVSNKTMSIQPFDWAEDRYKILNHDLTCYTNLEVYAFMHEARMDVFRIIFFWMIAFTFIGIVISCYLGEYRLTRMEEWRERIEDKLDNIKNV